MDKQTFNKLNFGQRDQLLLHAAVVEKNQLHLPEFQVKNLDVKTSKVNRNDIQLKNATLIGQQLTAKKHAELVIPNVFAKVLGEVLVDIQVKKLDHTKYILCVNDKSFTYFGDDYSYNYPKKEIVFNTGYQHKNDNIVIDISPGRYELKGINLIFNSYTKYLSLVKNKKEQSLQNIQYTEQSISGDIYAQKKGILFLSIPYSEGWHVKVDGVLMKPLKVNSAFTGILISKGKHKIEMYYITPYFIPGVSISFAVLICLIVYTYMVRMKKNSVNNLIQANRQLTT